MNDYENAPATKMLATNCVCCGRPLVDARSVELGIGPECRGEIDGNIAEDTRKAANKYVFEAAIAAQGGKVEEVLRIADAIDALGLKVLADKVRRRFNGVTERKVDITIEEADGYLKVKTPFRRGDKDAFIAAWRDIPGRRFKDGANIIPANQKMALWSLLKEFFGGKYGRGSKGLFRIPQPEPKPVVQAEPSPAQSDKLVQMELATVA